ncbi:unnamed protein product [Caenorhabditis auriculariae]|uniref:Uncharacterized protein n=1 Tax=Caenorhabditis auriculariae TaxID=2777116 RepID=A0A8S1HBF6_9PELO|nr:unnamed protein product [Caenorhabditis auriculariae]
MEEKESRMKTRQEPGLPAEYGKRRGLVCVEILCDDDVTACGTFEEEPCRTQRRRRRRRKSSAQRSISLDVATDLMKPVRDSATTGREITEFTSTCATFHAEGPLPLDGARIKSRERREEDGLQKVVVRAVDRMMTDRSLGLRGPFRKWADRGSCMQMRQLRHTMFLVFNEFRRGKQETDGRTAVKYPYPLGIEPLWHGRLSH